MRRCTACNSDRLIHFSSLRYKLCADCGAQLPWELEEAQAPLVANNRKKCLTPSKVKS